MNKLSAFVTRVKGLAAERMTNDEFVYDLSDEGTRGHVSTVIIGVAESAGCTMETLFSWTAEDFCTALAQKSFSQIEESGANPEQAASSLADDAVCLFTLFKNNSSSQDVLLTALKPVSESSAETEDKGADSAAAPTDPATTPVAEGAEGAPADPADPAAAPTDPATTPVAESAMQEVADAAHEATLAACAAEKAAKEAGATPDVKPVTESAIQLTLVPASEKFSQKRWQEVDRGKIKSTLRGVLEAGVDIESTLKDVYAVVGDKTNPDTWKYPHHTVHEGGAVLVSKTGVAASAGYLVSGRFRGSDVERQSAATHLMGHFNELKLEVPESLRNVAEASLGVRMLSLEVLGEDGKILPFEDVVQSKDGFALAVAESVANVLVQAGMMEVKEATIVSLSMDQISGMSDSLIAFGKVMMGQESVARKVDQQSIEESSARIAELEDQVRVLESSASLMAQDAEIRKMKTDALSSLFEGSPLEGIAESVVSATSLEEVKALKVVADTTGIKRLITAQKPSVAQTREDGVTTVGESGGVAPQPNLDGLARLAQAFKENDSTTTAPKTQPAKKDSAKRLIQFI